MSNRLAFVLGNGDYGGEGNLRMSVNDARAVSESLARLDFEVTCRQDQTRIETVQDFERFSRQVQPGDDVLVYYSGHGLEVNSENYIVPVGFTGREEEPTDHLVSIQSMIEKIGDVAARKIVLLDACRDIPDIREENSRAREEARERGAKTPPRIDGTHGLAAFSSGQKTFPGDTFIAFAAAPGSVALEPAEGKYSYFTEGLLAQIETANLPLTQLMQRVTDRVKTVTKATGLQQEPWSSSSMKAPFYFSRGSPIWFISNIIAFTSLFFSFVSYSIGLVSAPDWPYLAIAVATLLISVFLLGRGLVVAYRVSMGDVIEIDEPDWQRGMIGGYFGGMFAAPLLAYTYRLEMQDWDLQMNFGQLLAEATVASIITGAALGAVGFVFARNPIRLFGFTLFSRTASVSLVRCLIGGLLVGAVVGPAMTIYFGQLPRPSINPVSLIIPSIVAAASIVFSTITYSTERINYRKLRQNALAALASTVIVAVGCGSAAIPLQGPASAMERMLHTYDIVALGQAGLVFGGAIGLVMAFNVGLSLRLIELRGNA